MQPHPAQQIKKKNTRKTPHLQTISMANEIKYIYLQRKINLKIIFSGAVIFQKIISCYFQEAFSATD
jgi:hypothetical protein